MLNDQPKGVIMRGCGIAICLVLCAGASFGGVSPEGAAFDDLLKELSADSPDRRHEAVGALRKRLAGFEAELRREELVAAMGRLRRMSADESLAEDLRSQAKAVLEPFLSGAVLWSLEKGDCLGTAYRAKAVGNDFLVTGINDSDGVQEVERSWIALLSQTTGKAVWKLAGADLGMIPNFAEMIPEGILAGGLTLEGKMGSRKRVGCVTLFDRESRKRIWSAGAFPSAFKSARIVHGILVVAGVESGQQRFENSWVAALSPVDGKTLWIKRDIPGDLQVMCPTGNGIVRGIALGGFRFPEPKPGAIGGPCGWLALLDVKDGALVWSKRDIPGRVVGIEEMPGGILAIGDRPSGQVSDEGPVEGAGGGMLKMECWMGGYRFTDGQELWTRVHDRGDMNPPAFSAVPLKIVSANHLTSKWAVSESDPSDWVQPYVDREGKLRPEPFERGLMAIWAVAAVPGGFVAAGGDPMETACLLRRYAGPEKGFVRIWECETGKIDRLDTTRHGILAWGGRQNLLNAAPDYRFSLIDPDSGKVMWERCLNRGDWTARLYTRAVCQDGVLVGGWLEKRTMNPFERDPLNPLVDGGETIEREGFLRCYRLCDADTSPVAR